MAAQVDTDPNGGAASGASVIDIAEHREGYHRFLGWAKWGTVVSFVITAIVVVIIAP